MSNQQKVEEFQATSCDNGVSKGDAASRMNIWLQENPGMRIVSVAGDRYFMIAVVEPIPADNQRRNWRT